MREEDWTPCSEQGVPVTKSNGETAAGYGFLNGHFNNIHVLQEVVKLFLSETPERLNVIRQSLRRKDAAMLRNAAEALHDSAVDFGPNPAAEAAAKLATLGERGDWSGAEEAYRQLDNALHQLQPLIAARAIEPAS